MMAAVSGGGDAWRISGEDRAKHDAQFFTLKPVNGFVTGEQARGFFMQSGLPTAILGQIWSLADMNNDGKMDKKEFSIAMHLIKKKLQGYELPKTLPPSLKADPSPMMGSFGTMPTQSVSMMGMAPGMAPGMSGMAPGMPGMAPSMGIPVGMTPPVSMAMGQRMPVMMNGMPQMLPQTGFMGAPGVPVSGGFSGGMPTRPGVPGVSASAATVVGSLAMPHASKLKYTQLFNTNDRNKKGALTGVEARPILLQTGVPQQMLAQIWNLSDVDKDGKLNCDEFCIAMHLIDVVKMGQVLPAVLPPELIPGKARAGSFGPPPQMSQSLPTQKDSFGDLLGTMGMPAPVQIQPVANGETKQEELEPATFEDRRKINFDKGQAELDRRRQMLQEQMRKENEERMEKERKEQEKREKQRQEQELKKQQELERQLEKQREIERQREEQRQKMLEQREAARRELERQRQMEWERQRKEQLMVEKAREYEQLMAQKTRTSDLHCELESLKGKKTEFSSKITQVKNGVTDFTAHIEAMRSTRDLKNKDIDRLQQELREVNQRLSSVQSERQSLDLKVQTTVQANPMSETHRTMMHSVELKKTSVQRLKKELEQLEKDTATKLADIDTQNTQFNELNKTISQLQADISKIEKSNKESAKQEFDQKEQLKKDKEKHETLRKELEAQRLKEESSKPKTEAAKSSAGGGNWFDFGSDFSSQTKTAAASNDNWASVFDNQQTANASSDAWSAEFSSQTSAGGTGSEQHGFNLSGSKHKCKALYQFDSRNPDELSLQPGDIVMVFDNQTGAEPGWKGGEIDGKCGWFPEAYVEKVQEDSSQSVFPSHDIITTSEESSFISVPGKMPAVSPTPGKGQAAPDGLQAQALYPWKAKKDNHLSFNKGDIIHVTEQQDMWWSGEIGGKTGWFPKSYVRLIGGPTPTPPTSIKSDSPAPVVSGTGTPTGSVGMTAQSPPMGKPSGEQYIGVYSYQSDEPGDLTFNVGEIVTVTKKDGDWWTGHIGDRSGIFPANYVKVHEVQPDDFGLTSSFDNAFSKNDPFPSDPFSHATSEKTEQSPFKSDPFADDGIVSFDVGNGFSEDPFQGMGSSPGLSGFTEDPFSETWSGVDNKPNQDKGLSDEFASFSDISSVKPKPSDQGQTSGSKGQSSTLKPADSFSDFPKNDSSEFPDPPEDWIESMENDAKRSSTRDIRPLFRTQVMAGAHDSSMQTTDSLLDLESVFDSPKSPHTDSPLVSTNSAQILSSANPAPVAEKVKPERPSALPDLSTKTKHDQPSALPDLTTKAKPDRPPALPGKLSKQNSLHKEGLDPVSADTEDLAGILEDVKTGPPAGGLQTGTLKKPEIATVIAAYTATGSEQLSLSPGQLIQVRKKSPSGWWEGELQARGQKRKIGWFPANYVKLLVGSARNTPDNTLGSEGRNSPATSVGQLSLQASSTPPVQTSSTPQTSSHTYVDHVIAIYPYQAQHADELTFQKDAVINVIKKDDPDWWQGEFNGQVGMFPSNYVQNTTPESTS